MLLLTPSARMRVFSVQHYWHTRADLWVSFAGAGCDIHFKKQFQSRHTHFRTYSAIAPRIDRFLILALGRYYLELEK